MVSCVLDQTKCDHAIRSQHSFYYRHFSSWKALLQWRHASFLSFDELQIKLIMAHWLSQAHQCHSSSFSNPNLRLTVLTKVSLTSSYHIAHHAVTIITIMRCIRMSCSLHRCLSVWRRRRPWQRERGHGLQSSSNNVNYFYCIDLCCDDLWVCVIWCCFIHSINKINVIYAKLNQLEKNLHSVYDRQKDCVELKLYYSQSAVSIYITLASPARERFKFYSPCFIGGLWQ